MLRYHPNVFTWNSKIQWCHTLDIMDFRNKTKSHLYVKLLNIWDRSKKNKLFFPKFKEGKT